MALFEEEQITDTLQTTAPSIKYEGNEGPQDPRQEQMLAQLKEEYMQYVFSQNELGEPVMSFEEWYQMVYEASKMGVQAPQEEMSMQETMMREPAAYGGIMDTESGRRAYGLGSIFKKITKPIKKVGSKLLGGVKKVAKSPLGKAALLYAGTMGIPGTQFKGLSGLMKGKALPNFVMNRDGPVKKNLLTAAKKFLTGNKKGIASLGIGALSALPLLGIGTQKQQQEVVPDMGKLGSFDFDYDQMIRDVKGAKTTEDFADINTKYGTDLVEDETVYAADGGRIPFALGTKADFAIEDVMTGGVEDEIGGITGIMRQADLQRKGNVGQFYAAEGGMPMMMASNPSPGDELNQMSLMIFKKPLSELTDDEYEDLQEYIREKSAQGGRIGAQEGGIMDLGGMEKDYRETGGFVDIGAEEKADDVPARLSVNEFVMTADAVRGAGDGDIDKGAQRMENMMKDLEGKGKRFAGGGERGWKAQMRAMEIAEEEYGRDFYDLNDALQHKIYNRALQEIDDMLMGRQGASDMFEVSERLSEVV